MTGGTAVPVSPSRRAAAAAVHLLTATGVVWGLLALRAIAARDWKEALWWMLAAALVDAIDGPLARSVDVARAMPRIDGPLLDNLVDYLNWVVVPAWLIHQASLLPVGLATAGAAAICVTSAFQFTRDDAKTPDHHFCGFPSYWNVLAFYLLLLRPSPWVGLGLIVLFAGLVFAPLKCIHPARTERYRSVTLPLTVVWLAVLLALLVTYPASPRWLVWGSLFYVVYYTALSLQATFRARRSHPG